MGHGRRSPRVLVIALDAAEPSLVERWSDTGILPNLRRLRRTGAYGRLASSADWMAGSPWPTFYTGTLPSDHGLYHFRQWRSDRMTYRRPDRRWIGARPFWRDASLGAGRIAAFDMPMTVAVEAFDGVEIAGWASHDQLGPPDSYPKAALRQMQRRSGRSPIGAEPWGIHGREVADRLQDELTGATGRVAEAAAALLARERCELFLCALGATHRGGHRLWRVPGDAEEPSTALREIYVACDAALGRILDAAGDDATVLVVSLHGMGPNTNRTAVLPAMIEGVLHAGSGRGGGGGGWVGDARQLIPLRLRQRLKPMLPRAWQERLEIFWRLGGTDWQTSRAFALEADLQGYVRVNLRGRESAGIVPPEEYAALCDRIIGGLASFVDADTGERVVARALRIDEVYPEGPARPALPDILVRWSPTPAAAHRAIVSPEHGTIPWPTPGHVPDGRSGNHRDQGFVVAAGPGIAAGARVEGGHILDLAPTICRLLGRSPLPAMRGTVLDAIRPALAADA